MDYWPQPAPHYPDHRAWAEMLAGFSEKNARLSGPCGAAVAAAFRSRAFHRAGEGALADCEGTPRRRGQPLAGIKLHLEILEECAAGLASSASMVGMRARIRRGRIQTRWIQSGRQSADCRLWPNRR